MNGIKLKGLVVKSERKDINTLSMGKVKVTKQKLWKVPHKKCTIFALHSCNILTFLVISVSDLKIGGVSVEVGGSAGPGGAQPPPLPPGLQMRDIR